MTLLEQAVEAMQIQPHEDRTADFWTVRSVAAAELRARRSHFMPFVTNENGEGGADEAHYAAYCDRVETTATWGGHLELQALAGALKVPITVYEAAANNFEAREDGCEGNPLELSYHRHMFSLGEHYNSVVKI